MGTTIRKPVAPFYAVAVLWIVSGLLLPLYSAGHYVLLAVVSAPMLCGQIWVISLFLWACLLMVSWSNWRKLKPNQKKEGR